MITHRYAIKLGPAGPSFRPCGECHALVPADKGCFHWRPGVSVSAITSERHRGRRAAARLAARQKREEARDTLLSSPGITVKEEA